jgi:hypothetical protein
MQSQHPVVDDSPNLAKGIAAGLGAAVLGAVLWAAITAVTGYQIGFVAVGIGFLVGYAVKVFGKGDEVIFGIMGALLAFFGCLLGNHLAGAYLAAKQVQVPFFSVVTNPGLGMEIMKATFSPMDLIFYGIAIYEGYRFSMDEE